MNPTAELLIPEIEELVHERRLAELRHSLEDFDAADVASILQALEPADAAVAFRILPRDEAAEAFAYLDAEDQELIIGKLSADAAVRVVEAMDPDDRAALLDELPAEVATRLLAALGPDDRQVTEKILGYPPESVGRLMTPNYVKVRPEWTVLRALEQVRLYGRDAETVAWVFVVDDHTRLIDDIHISKLLLAEPRTTIAALMDEHPLSLQATDDREEAVRVMNRYDRTALPVLDKRGTLLGIVTSDDVADVAEIEATEDIQRLAGMGALEESYASAGLGAMLLKRGPWLAALFVGQSLTVLILSSFTERLEKVIALTLFIPLIISCGGNSGTQTAALLVRALALEEVEPKDWWLVLRREIVAGAALGVGLALVGVVAMAAWWATGVLSGEHLGRIILAVCIAIVSVVAWGAVLGSCLPLLLRRLGLDPAASSSPLVATLMDASGMLVYFGVAIAILGDALR
ncbi:MAG: magnesium transporter [Phycisphaerales bacterium]